MRHLKQKDKKLLKKFFEQQKKWIQVNSLLEKENLEEFKNIFLNFVHKEKCEENIACKIFVCAIDNELLKCEEEILWREYLLTNSAKSKNKKLIPITVNTDNSSILRWIEESRM